MLVNGTPPLNNWSFLTSWNPRNSDIFATANYDGSTALQSIQSTAPTSTTATAPITPTNPNDIFDPANFADTTDAHILGSSLDLERAPKGLQPPVGARFGFSGEEDIKRGQVAIERVVGEFEDVERGKDLIKAEEEEGGMRTFVGTRKSDETSKDTYSTLLALFDWDPKSVLIKLVGYDASPAALDEPRHGRRIMYPGRSMGRWSLGLPDLVRRSEVGEWREMLVVLRRWVEADSFSTLVDELDERVWSAEMPKKEKREAARVCFMADKKLERLVEIWNEEAVEEEGDAGN
ncbi:unnamed protein product [Rhizoctonia solani]|uniref:Uncharacterized protein n=1 Tax=Rhizoctonia solani TaxID=456999 RepID=A0A8H3GPG5_9AGAM|nr:unnamed protein product [Rhizoctonia solani]